MRAKAEEEGEQQARLPAAALAARVRVRARCQRSTQRSALARSSFVEGGRAAAVVLADGEVPRRRALAEVRAQVRARLGRLVVARQRQRRVAHGHVRVVARAQQQRDQDGGQVEGVAALRGSIVGQGPAGHMHDPALAQSA
jgi:hypothetical protein